jgi:hypothetical protein
MAQDLSSGADNFFQSTKATAQQVTFKNQLTSFFIEHLKSTTKRAEQASR